MRRSMRPLTTTDTSTIEWFSAWLRWSAAHPATRGRPPTPPPGTCTTGMPEYEQQPDLVDQVLAAGLAWMFDTVQPDGVLDQHHGASKTVGDRIYGFIPGTYAIVSMEINCAVLRHDQWGNLLNPLTDDDVAELEARLVNLGHEPIDRWNGAGSGTVSIRLGRSAHPTLLAAVQKYRNGCPEHQGPLCPWDGCRWYPDNNAGLIRPSWPDTPTEEPKKEAP